MSTANMLPSTPDYSIASTQNLYPQLPDFPLQKINEISATVNGEVSHYRKVGENTNAWKGCKLERRFLAQVQAQNYL